MTTRIINTIATNADEINSTFYPSNGTQRLPIGWREIDSKTWAQSVFFNYEPEAMGYESFYYDQDGNKLDQPIGGCKMFYFHNQTGIALKADYWKGAVKVYAFGCNHKYQEITFQELSEKSGYKHVQLHCDHAYQCSECGHTMIENSSD